MWGVHPTISSDETMPGRLLREKHMLQSWNQCETNSQAGVLHYGTQRADVWVGNVEVSTTHDLLRSEPGLRLYHDALYKGLLITDRLGKWKEDKGSNTYMIRLYVCLSLSLLDTFVGLLIFSTHACASGEEVQQSSLGEKTSRIRENDPALTKTETCLHVVLLSSETIPPHNLLCLKALRPIRVTSQKLYNCQMLLY